MAPTAVTSLGHNLDSDGTCGLAGPGDIPNRDPRLGPLECATGPTFWHPLLADSPAIDAGDDIGCPATDQRGTPRPLDGDGDGTPVCDIGAYEIFREIAPTPAPSVTPAPVPVALPPTGHQPSGGNNLLWLLITAAFVIPTGAGLTLVFAIGRRGQ